MLFSRVPLLFTSFYFRARYVLLPVLLPAYMCMNGFNYANVYRLFKRRSVFLFFIRSWCTRNIRRIAVISAERKSLLHVSWWCSRWNQLKQPVTKVSVSLNCWFQTINIYFFSFFIGWCWWDLYRLYISCNIFFSALLVVHILCFSSTSLLEWIDHDFLTNRVFQHDPEISMYDLWLSYYTVHVVYLLLLRRVTFYHL